LLGSVSGELGLRKYLERQGHTLIVTSDKEGANSVFHKELPDADIVISQPFWPAYLTAERIAKAKKLKLAITAGIGSDHVDLEAANEHGIKVAEVTYSNSISVSDHAVMMILSLVRNYLPPMIGQSRAVGTSRTALSGRMTWKECTWVQSQPAGLGWRSCAA
jgi:formate dehydrogenase